MKYYEVLILFLCCLIPGLLTLLLKRWQKGENKQTRKTNVS